MKSFIESVLACVEEFSRPISIDVLLHRYRQSIIMFGLLAASLEIKLIDGSINALNNSYGDQ